MELGSSLKDDERRGFENSLMLGNHHLQLQPKSHHSSLFWNTHMIGCSKMKHQGPSGGQGGAAAPDGGHTHLPFPLGHWKMLPAHHQAPFPWTCSLPGLRGASASQTDDTPHKTSKYHPKIFLACNCSLSAV